MRQLRIRYDGPAAVVADVRRFFRDDTITMASMRNAGGHVMFVEKKRYGRMVEKFDVNGVRTKIILMIFVRDTFNMPIWIQGVTIQDNDINDPNDHYWMGHEIPVADDPNEIPEDEVIE